VLLDQVGEPSQEARPVARRNRAPTRECVGRAPNGVVGLLDPGRREGRNDFLGRRVDNGDSHSADSTMAH
jgi:hypothetical protein